MSTQQRQVHRAMAAQLDRVNRQSAEQRIAELEAENARLRDLLQIARDRIAALQAGEQEQLPLSDTLRPSPTMLYKGRPATTVQNVAQFCGVHGSTIFRRLQQGQIAGEQLPGSNRWIVYLDQNFERRKR